MIIQSATMLTHPLQTSVHPYLVMNLKEMAIVLMEMISRIVHCITRRWIEHQNLQLHLWKIVPLPALHVFAPRVLSLTLVSFTEGWNMVQLTLAAFVTVLLKWWV